jgi:hypothetical protein
MFLSLFDIGFFNIDDKNSQNYTAARLIKTKVDPEVPCGGRYCSLGEYR